MALFLRTRSPVGEEGEEGGRADGAVTRQRRGPRSTSVRPQQRSLDDGDGPPAERAIRTGVDGGRVLNVRTRSPTRPTASTYCNEPKFLTACF